MLIHKGDNMYIVENGEVKRVSVVAVRPFWFIVQDNSGKKLVKLLQETFFTEEQAKTSIGGAK